MATTKKTAEKVADDAPKYSGPTSGVFAPGKVGKAAREAHTTIPAENDRVIPDRKPNGEIVETRF